jgi:hypothetical protein
MLHFHEKKNQFVEWSKFDTHSTQIHDRSLSWLGTGPSIKSALRGVKLVVWAQTIIDIISVFIIVFVDGNGNVVEGSKTIDLENSYVYVQIYDENETAENAEVVRKAKERMEQ